LFPDHEVFVKRIFVAWIVLLAGLAAAQQKPADSVLTALTQELDRSFQNLKKTPVPPYFLAYQLTDNRAFRVTGSFGTLTYSGEERSRILDIDLRVGNYDLDNTHPLRGPGRFRDMQNRSLAMAMPLDDDSDALRTALWYSTDRKYKNAVEDYEQVKANVAVKVDAEDKSGDFSPEPPQKYLEDIAPFSFDLRAWEGRIRRITAPFRNLNGVSEANAEVSGEIETRRYVSSEGSVERLSAPLYRLVISATMKAPDGMELPLHQTYMSVHPEGLPNEATILKDVNQMVQTLTALSQAPLAEPYTGPAILSGRASAVFFHEIFGHRVEGQRQKNEDEAQTFKKKVNQAVLPDFLSVYSDPTLQQIHGTELLGYYPYDDEGVKGRRVPVVEKGILKSFLMSRAPIEGFARSNGHGRRQQGYAVVARQSNLLVESSKSVPRDQLKKMLIEQIKAANKPYGLFFDDIEGGFTFTQRDMPNSFDVLPTVVYKVYPDGKEELVRGVDLIGTPLIAFSKIAAADDEVGVFNGICGAESGWVPVSAVSPGLLVSQIEVQRKEKSQEKAPALPAPDDK
jgi:predicted Zn-dependent protease